MPSKFLLFIILLFGLTTSIYAEHVNLGSRGYDVSAVVEESNDQHIVVRFEVGAFNRDAVIINGETYYLIRCGEEYTSLKAGEPALPRISRSIIIPDDAAMTAKVISAEYTDFPETPVAPSKGNLLRTVNPSDIPYSFGPIYGLSAMYPEDIVSLRDPFILRDHRGTVIDLNAFQYNPSTKTLRVYTSVTVDIINIGTGGKNVLRKVESHTATVPDFEQIYNRRFINYLNLGSKYTPLSESGDMLIITFDDFRSALRPLVQWKAQKGIKTTVIDVSSIGNDGISIKDFVQAFYDSTQLAWLLLVGDAAQVAPYNSADGVSDPSYAKLAGEDDYPDIFVGRFSAEAIEQVETQVRRTIEYEKTPQTGDWLGRATGIASSQGPGHFGEYDYQHMDNIRAQLLTYNYVSVDRIYDPNATASQVTAVVNEGRGVINYIGHGSTLSWSTTGFSNSDVKALVNQGRLPFIHSVACVNGNFVNSTCFAEAWLRATRDGLPIGAIAAYMSTINQSWSPPMYAQDETADLLVSEDMLTVGGLCYNGSCRMIDITGTDGVQMYNTWHIFGDPSVMLRTNNPTIMTVNHDAVILFNASETSVDVTGISGALCTISGDTVIYGSAYTGPDGLANIQFIRELPPGDTLTLTVTAFNRIPYISPVEIIVPQGPYVIYNSSVISDLSGNSNGLVECGESIDLGIRLTNVGAGDAYNVDGTLSTDDPYITMTRNTAAWGTIPAGSPSDLISDAFAFSVAGNTPDNHFIAFRLTVTGSDGQYDSTWTSAFNVPVHAPKISYINMVFNDASGNNNGILDPGETAELVITLRNDGSINTFSIAGTLDENDSYITLPDSLVSFGDMTSGGTANNSTDVCIVSAEAFCPMGYHTTMQLSLTGSGGFSAIINIELVVGDKLVFYKDDFSLDMGWSGLGGPGEWTIGPAGGGSSGSGGPDPSEDHSPGGDERVLGNDLAPTGGSYNPNLAGTYWVTSPRLDCSNLSGIEMTYYHWLGVESNIYDHAYFQVFDGTQWITLFQNTDAIDESSWNQSFHNLSYYADNNPDFQFRFGIGSTDGAYQYCGWNIDDIEIKGYSEVLLENPKLEYSPAALQDTLHQGAISQDTVTIRNRGQEILRIRFSSPNVWLFFDKNQHNLSPGDSLNLSVNANTAVLIPGDHLGILEYVTNDPLHRNESIPIALAVRPPFVCGDINDDQAVNILDAAFLINYLYKGGATPNPVMEADTDSSGNINILDVSVLINYLYKQGPKPTC